METLSRPAVVEIKEMEQLFWFLEEERPDELHAKVVEQEKNGNWTYKGMIEARTGPLTVHYLEDYPEGSIKPDERDASEKRRLSFLRSSLTLLNRLNGLRQDFPDTPGQLLDERGNAYNEEEIISLREKASSLRIFPFVLKPSR